MCSGDGSTIVSSISLWVSPSPPALTSSIPVREFRKSHPIVSTMLSDTCVAH
jgi:hypothetical protein